MDILNALGQALLQSAVGTPGFVPDQTEEDPEDINVTAYKPVAPQQRVVPPTEPTVYEPGPLPRVFRPEEKPEGAEYGYKLGNSRKEDKLPFIQNVQDAILMAYGMEPRNRMERDEARLKDAMDIYRQNKDDGIRAINDINPTLARTIYEKDAELGMKGQELSRQEQEAQRRAQAERLKAFGTIASYANAIRDDASYQRMRPLLQAYIDDHKLQYSLPARYDAAIIQDLIKAAMGPYKDTRLEQQGANTESMIARRASASADSRARVAQVEDRIEIARKEAESRAAKRQWEMDNPPASRSPERRTNSGGTSRPAPKPGAVPKGPPGSVHLGNGLFRMPNGQVVKVKAN